MLATKGSHADHSSVTIGRTPRGDYTFEVTVRATGEGGQVPTIEAAEALCTAVVGRLRDAFPTDESAAGSAAVTLTRNAKGETQIEVTARSDSQTTNDAINEAESAARVSFDRARSSYPMSTGFVGAKEGADNGGKA